MKRITEDQIILNLCLDRGLKGKPEELLKQHRKDYDPELVRRASKGDPNAVIELVKIGLKCGPATSITEE